MGRPATSRVALFFQPNRATVGPSSARLSAAVAKELGLTITSDSSTDKEASGGYRELLKLPVPRRLAMMSLPADFADWVDYSAVLALLVFTWGEGPLVLAFFALALSLPYVVIGPFLAVLIDRLPLRTVLIVSNAGRALATLGFIFAGDTTIVLALVFARSAVDSAFSPARQAAIQATTPPLQLSEANGLHHAINQTSKIVGPAVGGLLLAIMPIQAVFGLNAVLSIVAAAIAATVIIGPRPPIEDTSPESFLKRTSAGIGAFWQNPRLKLALIFSVTAYFAVFLYDALMALLTDDFGLGATAFGLSIGASGAGGLLGALLAGRIAKTRPFRLMSLAAIFGGLVSVIIGAAALLDWSVNLVIFMIVSALMGGSFGFVTVPYRTIIQTETPPDRIARVFAAGEAVTVVVMLSAPFIGSAIASQFGTGAAFGCGGVLLAVLGAVVLVRRRRAVD